ncbi:MAG: glycosyltransferase family 4 protein [Planctomycetota bacterium]
MGTVGIGMTAWHQVHGLLRQGVRVSLFCASCEKPLNGLDVLKETLQPLGIKLPIRVIGKRRSKALHDEIVAKAIRRIHKKSKIDVVHCWPSGALETLRTAKELEIKTVLERLSAHTRYVYEVTKRECEKLAVRLKKTHYAAYNQAALLRQESEFALADKLLCPSEFVVRTFLEKGHRKEQLARHRYGYDPTAFYLGRPRSTRGNNRLFTVAYIGECNPLKGLHFALKAWAESDASKNGKFYICGRFVSGYKQSLKQFLIHPSVEYLGFMRNPAEVMCKSDVLILPSLAEGSALVTYEARACGCVLLVSEASGAYCTHMHDALVHKEGDVDCLREHIDMLASDRSFYLGLKNNSLAGLGELTWEKAAETLVNVYHETIQSNTG